MDAVIVDTDTLRAMGLRQLLEERHALSVVIATDPTQVKDVDESTLFFVTPEAFASRPYFYVPRRERVALISSLDTAPLPVIRPGLSEHEIEGQLDSVVRSISADRTATLSAPLSDREREVLRLIAMGRINKEIAATLGISFNTVLSHRRNIMDKLGVRSVPGLSMYAVMNGIVSQKEL